MRVTFIRDSYPVVVDSTFESHPDFVSLHFKDGRTDAYCPGSTSCDHCYIHSFCKEINGGFLREFEKNPAPIHTVNSIDELIDQYPELFI